MGAFFLRFEIGYSDWKISDTIWRNLGLLPNCMVLPKGIEVSPNCLKMLLKYCGNLIFGRFMVNGR